MVGYGSAQNSSYVVSLSEIKWEVLDLTSLHIYNPLIFLNI